ncbi:phosphatase PAP2 family protein [Chthonobacter rhizosphaerae]|uniref:phosphatase PAP2 family protein n=1 Tax=Chthonobacter rhizosphaerae TaxID=2735553 RepID=UPI0015EF7D37|nr:phosphatase PAP2 family protein [Chthonobacter rhizosphaerae]
MSEHAVRRRLGWLPFRRLPEFKLLLALIVLSGGLYAFFALAEEVAEGETRSFDEAIMLALRVPGDPSQPIGPWWMEVMFADITSLGSTTALAIMTLAVVGYLLISRHTASAILVLASVAGGQVLSSLLKNMFQRPRPDLVDHIVQVHSLSFPSGHAMLSAATYLTLGALLARTETVLALRGYILSVAVALTLLIGVSRVYLGVHYPTDVAAGWCAGALWAMACWLIASRLRRTETADV